MWRRMVMNIAVLLVVLLALLWAYVRFAPNPVERVHLDPVEEGASGENAAFVGPPDAPVFATDPDTLFEALDEIVLATPGSTKVATGPEARHVSYLVRTPLVGFPDYVSVRVLPAEGGSTLAIWSRSRFGRSDLGANTTRIEGWRERLAERFSSP